VDLIKRKNPLSELFKKTVVYKCRPIDKQPRRRLWIDKYKYIYWSEIVWNHHNPDNKRTKGKVIHHIDGNCFNDNINNLQLLSHSEHSSLHGKNNIVSEETKQKLREINTGKKHSEETKQKLRDHIISKETRLKMSLSRTKEKNPMWKKQHTEEAKRKMSESHI
jgi:hypothetical protein